MSERNLRHMDGYRFPAEEIPNASEDHFMVVGEYTENRSFNLDGTKVQRTSVLAHGTRERVMEMMERQCIDDPTMHYRSRKYGADYFRSGIENALDNADVVTNSLKDIEAVIGHRANKHRDLSVMKGILMGGEWKRDGEYDGVKGRAPVTPAVMHTMSRVGTLLGGDDSQVFRRFEVAD